MFIRLEENDGRCLKSIYLHGTYPNKYATMEEKNDEIETLVAGAFRLAANDAVKGE